MFIVKVPGINAPVNTKGCRNAGNNIFEALDSLGSNEQRKIIDRKLLDLEEIEVDNSNLEEQQNKIIEKSLEFLKKGKTIFLGGDHSISFSTGKSFLDYCREKEKEPCLIVFDAHADCCKPGKEPNHEEWLRGLIEQGFPAKNVLLVGARNLWREEIEFLGKNKIQRININDINNRIEEIADTITEFGSGKEVYVSFDIDVIDPASAPATGYKEPGGLTSRQAIYIVSRIAKIKNLKAIDIVEVDVEKDRQGDTAKLAGKLLGELL